MLWNEKRGLKKRGYWRFRILKFFSIVRIGGRKKKKDGEKNDFYKRYMDYGGLLVNINFSVIY